MKVGMYSMGMAHTYTQIAVVAVPILVAVIAFMAYELAWRIRQYDRMRTARDFWRKYGRE